MQHLHVVLDHMWQCLVKLLKFQGELLKMTTPGHHFGLMAPSVQPQLLMLAVHLGIRVCRWGNMLRLLDNVKVTLAEIGV